MTGVLTSLRIRNLALVEELEWELASGFTAVTGETGSGKSIIVGALQLVVGERADKTLIRSGADTCSVEAIFSLPETAPMDRFFAERGIEPCDGSTLIIKRTFTTAGANRQFVNGSATTVAVLKELGEDLVDLHGPHDHQSLLSTERQLAMLDAFGGAEELRAKFTEHFRAVQRLSAAHAELAGNEAALERETDLLKHQVREIDAAQLRAEEEEELIARYTVASNSRRLAELGTQLLDRLSESEESALTRLAEAGRLLRDLARLDPATAALGEAHARAVTELEELTRALQTYLEKLEIEPAQLAALEQRVSLVETLKRKYGGTLGEVINFGERAAERLRKIESRGEELERLTREIELARKAMLAAGGDLSRKRRAAAPKLASTVTVHLRDLGFKKAEFSVSLAPLSEPGLHGLESVEFVFAPNPGEPAKPLRAIASSGEISRVMLALKSALAAQDTISLLVFDEIDANVGGEIAHAVGAKMKSLAGTHQVICISHLPQVAALADSQFMVTKEFRKERTVSMLQRVEGEARAEEIARMLGGKGESALAHAHTLLGG